MFVTNFLNICFPSYVPSRASHPAVDSHVSRCCWHVPVPLPLSPSQAPALLLWYPQHWGWILPRPVLLLVGSGKLHCDVAHNIQRPLYMGEKRQFSCLLSLSMRKKKVCSAQGGFWHKKSNHFPSRNCLIISVMYPHFRNHRFSTAQTRQWHRGCVIRAVLWTSWSAAQWEWELCLTAAVAPLTNEPALLLSQSFLREWQEGPTHTMLQWKNHRSTCSKITAQALPESKVIQQPQPCC